MAWAAVEHALTVPKTGPLDAVVDAHMRGGRAADGAQQSERMRRLLLVDENVLVGFFHRGEAARAGADDRGRALAILEGDIETRLLERFARGGARILRIAVGEKKGFGFALGSRIEIADLAPDPDIQVLQVHALYRPDAAFSLLYRRPELGHACPQRRNHARSGNSDAARLAVLCHI